MHSSIVSVATLFIEKAIKINNGQKAWIINKMNAII